MNVIATISKKAFRLALIFSVCIIDTDVFSLPPPGIRSDLHHLIHTKLCGDNHAVPSPQQLNIITKIIKNSSHDAGARLITLKIDPSISDKTLATKASQLAKQRHHHGWAWGICSNPQPPTPHKPHIAWIITTPSGYPSLHPQLNDHLRSHCNTIEILISPQSHTDHPQDISFEKWQRIMRQKQLQKTDPQSLSLRCHPHSPPWLGPVMWFLRQNKTLVSPLTDAPPADDPLNLSDQLTQLINHARTQRHLHPVIQAPTEPHKSLTQAAQKLTAIDGLIHDDHQLKQLAIRLRRTLKPSFVFGDLSELRVVASSAKQAYENLMSSPSHARVLVAPTARWIAMAIKIPPPSHPHPSLIIILIVHEKT